MKWAPTELPAITPGTAEENTAPCQLLYYSVSESWACWERAASVQVPPWTFDLDLPAQTAGEEVHDTIGDLRGSQIRRI